MITEAAKSEVAGMRAQLANKTTELGLANANVADLGKNSGSGAFEKVLARLLSCPSVITVLAPIAPRRTY